jgi:4-hydroxyphenylpyruvate dioxygenase
MLKPAIATLCLGRSPACHDILDKITEASRAGFQGVEVFFECLEDRAKRRSSNFKEAPRDDALKNAARDVRSCCDQQNTEVMVLQPFAFYDGLIDPAAHSEKIEELKLWFELCKILGTDLIQVPTNFKPSSELGDSDKIVADMTEAADLGLQQTPPIRFAYEPMSWGSKIDVWEGGWEVVKRASRPNLGLCLDTFHIAGRVWGDPAADSGRNENADTALDDSLKRLTAEVDPTKIFYVQIGDTERLDPPLSPAHPFYNSEQKSRMSWSRNARLFAYENDRGGYLPINRVMDAIFVKMGWKGWVSMEMFTPGHYEEGADIPKQFASRAKASWEKFCQQYSAQVS